MPEEPGTTALFSPDGQILPAEAVRIRALDGQELRAAVTELFRHALALRGVGPRRTAARSIARLLAYRPRFRADTDALGEMMDPDGFREDDLLGYFLYDIVAFGGQVSPATIEEEPPYRGAMGSAGDDSEEPPRRKAAPPAADAADPKLEPIPQMAAPPPPRDVAARAPVTRPVSAPPPRPVAAETSRGDPAEPPPPAPARGRGRRLRLPDIPLWGRIKKARGDRTRKLPRPDAIGGSVVIGRDIHVSGNAVNNSTFGRTARAKPPAPEGPPHVAYGLVDCLAEAVAEVPFEVTVGLSERPSAGVAGVAMDLPALETEPYSVFVRLVAPGFAFAPGESRRRELKVSKDSPYPKETVQLIPKRPTGDRQSLQITAEFSMDGVRIADAIRAVAVVPTAAARTRPKTDHVKAGVDIAAPTSEEAADLTITIRYGERDDWLDWTLDTPHDDVVHPADKPVARRIGNKPEAFLRAVISEIGEKEGTPGIYTDVLGLGRQVTGAVPPEIWQAIRAVAVKTGQPPSILLVSEEPYIPWELAFVDPPLIPALKAAPPFLSAQARIGRWLQAVAESDGQGRPAPKPPAAKQVRKRAVIWGDYSKTEWASLTDARDEAKALIKDYGMVTIEPTNQAMYTLLKDRSGPDLLHFAVHGKWSEDGTDVDGIILTDGETLEAPQISGRTLDQAPVVFLNACQVGAGHAVLGRYSGIAAAFVEAGASGVIAPLWSIDDSVARGVALDFYKRVAAGESPSEVLRTARSAFIDDFDTKSATTMAYQFFGHPGLTVTGLN